MPLLKQVAALAQRPAAPTQIRRATGLTRGVVKRIMERILGLGEALLTQARSEGLLHGKADPSCMIEILRLTKLWPGWVTVTYFLSRIVYSLVWPPGSPPKRATQFGQ